MRILHLTLKKKWFDMIASGEKKEEYREGKDYWLNRLMYWEYRESNNSMPRKHYTEFKKFDVVVFKNGYAKNAPTITIECLGIYSGMGEQEWGAEKGKEYFIIKLGNILSQF